MNTSNVRPKGETARLVQKMLDENPGMPARQIALRLGQHPSGIQRIILRLKQENPSVAEDSETRNLLAEIDRLKKEALTHAAVREYIIKVTHTKPVIPNWIHNHPKNRSSPGVPSLFLSDFHWGEVVDPLQIGSVNEYNLGIAKTRLKGVVGTAITLLKHHMVRPEYPGIVVPLGGDMFSGNIHDELAKTNEKETMFCLVDLLGQMIAAIKTLRDEFGKVFLPCVTGNHGRMTLKVQAKNRHHTNFDWLLYQLLDLHFQEDENVSFLIPDGSDASYSVYGHRYLLTHGDQFRGGDGLIGMLGPVTRGDHKKRSRNSQIGMDYDTLLLGHWHQLIQMQRMIANGCFPFSAAVMTDMGYTEIGKISPGDVVMSGDGSRQVVSHVFNNSSDRIVGIKVMGLPYIIEATPNHAVMAIKRASHINDVTPTRRCHVVNKYGPAQWIPIDFLSPGDFVHVPFPKGEDRPIDCETAWAYGLYLAEGSTLLDGGSSKKHNRIVLTMHTRELPILQRFSSWFSKTFNRTPRVYIRKRKNGGETSEFAVSPGRETCVMFRDLFGHGALNKHLPDGCLWWSDDLKAALLAGWIDGDGHRAKQDDCRTTVSATTISPNLAWGMFHIAPALGTWPSLSRLAKGGRRKHDSFTVSMNSGQNVIINNGDVFYRIGERFESDKNVPVFDLEVTGEHTYNVGGMCVHNSLKGYDEYAYAGNFPYEPPRQACWITHPEKGITFQMPIHAETNHKPSNAEWVSVFRREK